MIKGKGMERVRITMILLCLCLCLSACSTARYEEMYFTGRQSARPVRGMHHGMPEWVYDNARVKMADRFYSSLLKLKIITFAEYSAARMVQAEVEENRGTYLIVNFLDNDYDWGDVDVAIRDEVDLTDIEPSDVVYICYDGLIREKVPPFIIADRIFYSEEKGIAFLWEEYREHRPEYIFSIIEGIQT